MKLIVIHSDSVLTGFSILEVISKERLTPRSLFGIIYSKERGLIVEIAFIEICIGLR